ncbi:hypothetical protein [Sinomicrobium soli]|uniref:hypothetical protein n=1 Tax=Sinomicrobium sp. N-1-3-6 TaxID=2219864 RepID=UPI000DCF3F1B|nr:hypothetical protein [Sinomicrobium sp. N-1-3-6]RAV27482.1 hypothetical protein DN748_18370 [Sinomicrobium sp. N-1-3-6]
MKQNYLATYRILFVIVLTGIPLHAVQAQTARGQYIRASIGFGMSAPYEDVDIDGTGMYAQGEYLFNMRSWFSLRPYAGVIFTKTRKSGDDYRDRDYKVTSNAFLLGGKARFTAPIPWVAPYLETGVGASLGSFETYIPSVHIKKNGILWHIPLSLGLLVGPRHDVDIGLVYYYHPSAEQFSGALAFGLSFPIR